MSGLYVYAVLESGARAAGAGLAGEPLRVVACGDLAAAVGDMAEAPALDAHALRAHDAVVRALAQSAEAILPARFGCFVKDEPALRDALHPRAGELGEALRLVRGCEQMTVRVYGTDGATPPAGEPTAGAPVATARPGTEYLVSRQRERQRARAVPELDPVRPALSALVRDERAQRHRTPPLLASVYHLIERGQAAAYQETLTRAAASLGSVRVSASGPWPPYAFAPEGIV
ncbi:MAG TPA: GvpL/GvpF family gas vesicle protein [Candidatus Limnocylindria bacterium]|nr:GvpL/GvpF family gas vesicle protein [Candidatus Limnocylindria bacterium]